MVGNRYDVGGVGWLKFFFFLRNLVVGFGFGVWDEDEDGDEDGSRGGKRGER